MAVWHLRVNTLITLPFHFSLLYEIYCHNNSYGFPYLIDESANISMVMGYSDGRRIVGGYIATRGEFPYQTALQVYNALQFKTFCGGSVIGDNWIVTAGHCADKAKGAVVYCLVGVVEISKSGKRYLVSNILIHPDYEYREDSDLALLQTSEIIKFNRFVKPINIMSNYKQRAINCVISGWGALDPNGKLPSNDLKGLIVNIVDQKICNKILKIRDSKSSKLICCLALDEDKDTCNGDSGGPLVCDNVLVGVLSFGSVPCAIGSPMFCVKVLPHKKWVKDVMSNRITSLKRKDSLVDNNSLMNSSTNRMHSKLFFYDLLRFVIFYYAFT